MGQLKVYCSLADTSTNVFVSIENDTSQIISNISAYCILTRNESLLYTGQLQNFSSMSEKKYTPSVRQKQFTMKRDK